MKAKFKQFELELAWHYQEAGETNQAILYWIAASGAALHRSVHHEALSFARHGLALIHEDTPDQQRHELNLHLCQASALTTLMMSNLMTKMMQVNLKQTNMALNAGDVVKKDNLVMVILKLFLIFLLSFRLLSL